MLNIYKYLFCFVTRKKENDKHVLSRNKKYLDKIMISYKKSRGFIKILNRWAKGSHILCSFMEKDRWDVKSSSAKSCSQTVNLPGAQPLMKPLIKGIAFEIQIGTEQMLIFVLSVFLYVFLWPSSIAEFVDPSYWITHRAKYRECKTADVVRREMNNVGWCIM